jgi:hypothetical protein
MLGIIEVQSFYVSKDAFVPSFRLTLDELN